jgi:hypothetical protein
MPMVIMVIITTNINQISNTPAMGCDNPYLKQFVISEVFDRNLESNIEFLSIYLGYKENIF